MGMAIKKTEAARQGAPSIDAGERCGHEPRVSDGVTGTCHCYEYDGGGGMVPEPERTYAERMTRFVEDLVAHGASLTSDKAAPSVKKTKAMAAARAKAIAASKRRR